MKKCIFAIVLMLIPVLVNAQSSCSYEDQTTLSSGANLITINYNEKSKEADPGSFFPSDDELNNPDFEQDSLIYFFEIEILNITENHYVVVKNDETNLVKTINYSDTINGVYKFEHSDLNSVYSYTFEIYSSDKTECKDEVFGTDYLTTPKYNNYAGYVDCEGYEDEEVCQQYTTVEDMSESDFYEKINSLKEKENGENNEEEETVMNQAINIILIILVILVLAAGIYLLVVMQRRRRKL